MRCSKSCYLCDLELVDLFDNEVIEQVYSFKIIGNLLYSILFWGDCEHPAEGNFMLLWKIDLNSY